MSDDILTRIFGRGWAFPPAFSIDDGVVMANGAEDVRQSLRILFSTEPGERIMRDGYGCALYDVMFENINGDLTSNIEARVVDAILRYEPRANLTRIRVYQSRTNSSTVSVEVTYCLRGGDVAQRMSGTLDIGQAVRGVLQ
jgi:hypothetical protein